VHNNIECDVLLEDIVPYNPTRDLRSSKLFTIPFITCTQLAMNPILRTLDQCNRLQISPYQERKEFDQEMKKKLL